MKVPFVTRSPATRSPAPQILVGVVWVCFLAKAVFYVSFLPLWEGQDEYAHFAFIQYLANNHSLPPLRGASVSREVAESLQLAPVAWEIRRPPSWVPYDLFWRLTPGEREGREKALRAMPPIRSRESAQPAEPLYEAQQAPLAYAIFWPLYRAFEGSELSMRVWVLRIAGAVIASLAIPLGYLTASRIFRN